MYRKNPVIYCIENLINGKKYIGKAIRFEQRKRWHLSNLKKGTHDNDYLQKSFDKNGVDGFKIWIIEECDDEILSEREIFYIKEWNTKSPNGYNLTDGGDGSAGYKHTAENLVKISSNRIYAKGKDHPFYGKHHSDESKKKMSASQKLIHHRSGWSWSKDAKENISKIRTGKPSIKDRSRFSSEFYGVSYAIRDKRWRCFKSVNGKVKCLGSFKNEIDAAKRWDEYVLENNLEDAFPLNFPMETSDA